MTAAASISGPAVVRHGGGGGEFVENQPTVVIDDVASDNKPSSSLAVSGILFSRSVRSSFASLTLAPISSTSTLSTATTEEDQQKQQDQPPILVRLQFTDDIQELRSFCRKQYKIGDQIEFLCADNGRWERSSSSAKTTTMTAESSSASLSKENTNSNIDNASSLEQTADKQSWSQQPRWVVDLSSISDARKSILVRTSRVWNMKDCQQYQLRYIPQKKRRQPPPSKKKKRENDDNNGISNDNDNNGDRSPKEHLAPNISASLDGNDENRRLNSNNNHHGGGKEKRLLAQELISFFMKIIANKLVVSPQPDDDKFNTNNTPTTSQQRQQKEQTVRDWFNRGDGVLDVAGGCGHVSMALGINGILSTVVDARSTVGKLPGRDRKIWKRSLMNKPPRQRQQQQQQKEQSEERHLPHSLSEYEYCQPVVAAPVVVPFQSQQAWFGSKPIGYDASFRHPDEEDIPVLVATTISRSNNDNDNDDRGARRDGDSITQSPSSTSSSLVLRRQTSALVALHPDEATGEIVRQAVQYRIPFVVVPCCVFARLFPERQTKDGRSVSSYEDLLDFLQEQDSSIQRTQLSFEGKNIALWSVFPDE